MTNKSRNDMLKKFIIPNMKYCIKYLYLLLSVSPSEETVIRSYCERISQHYENMSRIDAFLSRKYTELKREDPERLKRNQRARHAQQIAMETVKEEFHRWLKKNGLMPEGSVYELIDKQDLIIRTGVLSDPLWLPLFIERIRNRQPMNFHANIKTLICLLINFKRDLSKEW